MQQSTGLLGQLARPEDKVGGLLGMMFKNMTPDRADQIRAGLAGLQGIGNQGVYNAATQRMGDRKAQRREDTLLQRQQAEQQAAEAKAAQQREAAARFALEHGNERLARGVMDGLVPTGKVYEYLQPSEAYRQVTGEELGYTGPDAGKLFNVGPDGKITAIGGGGTSVQVNTGTSESEFDKKTGGFLAEEAQDIATQGMQAQRNMSQIDQLGALLESTGGGPGAAFTAAASKMGIKLDGASELEAANAIISQLVPQQRPPGSGTMSDADLTLFKNSLPQLMNTPEGNKIIIDTMRNIAMYDMERGKIARQLQLGQLTQNEAIQAYEQLGNPLAGFTPPAAAGDGAGGADDMSDDDMNWLDK